MTKKSATKQHIIAFFLWGYVFAHATQPQQVFAIYKAAQTITTGVKNVSLSDSTTTTVPILTQEKAIIYISANTVFTAPAAVLHHAVVIHTDKIKSSITKVIAKSETKKSVVSPKTVVREQKNPPPFRNTPYQNQQQFLSCGTASVTFFVDDDISNANVVATLSSEFLKSIRQRSKVSFDEVAFLSLCESLQAHTTRPPPFC